MKFTITEWAMIKRALATALCECEQLMTDLAPEIKINELSAKDFHVCKEEAAKLSIFIDRIENALL